jgi:hypothetical protein
MAICGIEYKQCYENYTLFYKYSGHIIIIIVYIDDIMITENEEEIL